MRTTWNGSLSFGLVSIPVGLAPATKPAARASDISFRMLHRECLTPIKQKRYCPVHERDLGPDEIVKGWEVAKGQFVVVEEAELEALQQHDDSRAIEITRFVDAGEVDPIYFDRTYFLVPAQAPAARRPYVLLLNAMRDSGMAAIGRFIQQGKEKFCLIRAKDDALALETLYLAADVYSQAEIREAVEDTSVKEPELALARQVIASLAAEFEPLLVRLRQGAERLQLRLEERLVDLPLVDRHALLDADADYLLPLDSELLRKLVGREVVRHRPFPPIRGNEKARWRRRGAQAGWLTARSLSFAGITGPAAPSSS